VAAAFELSYRQLDEDAARLFRLLPVDPGPDVSTVTVGALAGRAPGQARTVLGRLVKAHLVEAASGGAGRWRMHDLLRLYARQLSGTNAGEREQAMDRLLGYYLNGAAAADAHLRTLAGASAPTEFTDRDEALAWLDSERVNLIAAVAMAAETGRDQIAMKLPLDLNEYLSWRRRFDDWLTVLLISRDCARRQGDRAHEAAALGSLGVALRQVRRFEDAISAHQDAVAIFRETGDRHGEGMTLNNLGSVLRQVRRFDEAISAHQDAAAIFRDTSDRHSQSMALQSLESARAAAAESAGQ
jgi:tetratricopeptide (TPR) repeat protein